jgi:hypothetical protein
MSRDELVVSIQTPKGHIKGSPWTLKNIQGPECHCPAPANSWMVEMRCSPPNLNSTFYQKLKLFPIISESLIDEAIRELKSPALMHYTILDGKVCKFFHPQIFNSFLDLCSASRRYYSI